MNVCRENKPALDSAMSTATRRTDPSLNIAVISADGARLLPNFRSLGARGWLVAVCQLGVVTDTKSRILKCANNYSISSLPGVVDHIECSFPRRAYNEAKESDWNQNRL